ncbi:MAG: hypothetical protein VW076_09000, partial [Synechococcus sp.]
MPSRRAQGISLALRNGSKGRSAAKAGCELSRCCIAAGLALANTISVAANAGKTSKVCSQL